MKELAHFLQFFSFSIGILAIYVSYQLLKQSENKGLKKLFYFIIGINFIVFIHVLEAFFKIIFGADVFDNQLPQISTLILYPLGFVRIFMAALFISFCQELVDKRKKSIYLRIASATFILFAGWTTYFYLSPNDLSLSGKISFWSIHFILSAAMIIGAIFLLNNNKKIFYPKNTKLFATFIIIYAIIYITIRTIDTYNGGFSEHLLMAILGFTSLSFNAFIIYILKRMFIRKRNTANLTPDALNNLFNEYGITNREQEIIKLICEGKTNKEIGEILFISPVTVRDHNSNIFKKTNVTNRTQLAGIFQAYY